MTLKRGRFRVSDRLAVPEKPFGLTLPALPHLLFAGRHYDLPANSAAAEIAASLLLPLAARGRNSSGFSTAAEKAPALYPPQAAGRRFSPLKNYPILKRPRGACGPPVGFPEGLRGTEEGTRGQPLRPRCARPPPLAQGRLSPGASSFVAALLRMTGGTRKDGLPRQCAHWLAMTGRGNGDLIRQPDG